MADTDRKKLIEHSHVNWNANVCLAIGFVLGAAAAATLIVVIASGNTITWFDNHDGLAAWVQAAAVILAMAVSAIGIGIAIYVPWKQTKDRRDDESLLRRAQARNLTVSFFPALIELATRIETLLVDIRGCIEKPILFSGLPPTFESTVNLRLIIPTVLLRARDRLYLLGESGLILQQALAKSIHYGVLRDALRDGIAVHSRRGNVSSLLKDLARLLEENLSQLNECRVKLVEVHDTPVDLDQHTRTAPSEALK